MDTPKQFEIAIRRRIPFVSNLIYACLIFFFAILFILYLVMLPARNASGEMATAYFILVVPETLKSLSVYSAFGLLITVPLYYSARLHKPATLTFQEDSLYIAGKKVKLNIPVTKIEKVYCNDLHNLLRQPRGILQFVIRQKNSTVTTFRLKFYEQGEQVLQVLSELKNVQFAFYEDNMVTDHQEE